MATPIPQDPFPQTMMPDPEPTDGPAASVPLPVTLSDSPRAAPWRGPNVPGYEILGELGRGGMGVVYKARQIQADRLVALKMILSGDYASAAECDRFLREAQAAARLRHTGIVQVYEVGVHDGHPYFSLEFVEGGSLDRRLRGTPCAPRQAAQLVEGLARAMHAAHEQNVVHRDLKPANILLSTKYEGQRTKEDRTGTSSPSAFVPGTSYLPKITDFGLAKLLGDDRGQTGIGAVVGTPSYMAPEQARGSQEVGPPADVYALGAILYEMLTGRPPHKGASVADTLRLVTEADPVAPRQFNPGVPRDLETVCLKCLQKDSARRYGSAEALAEDLRRWQAGEPILARPAGRVERLLKWVRRRPAVAAALGMGGALVLVLGVGGPLVAIRQTQLANDARVSEDRAKERLRERNAMFVRTLLAPVGDHEGIISPFEHRAFLDLAALEEDDLRLRFLAAGLADRKSADRLRLRSALVVHSCVGLDPDRRDRTLDLLGTRMRETDDEGVRLGCAWLALELEPDDPGPFADVLLAGMRRARGDQQFRALAARLQTAAGRLDPARASEAARVILAQLGKGANALDPQLLKDLRAYTARVGPAERTGFLVEASKLLLAQLRQADNIQMQLSATRIEELAGAMDAAEAGRLREETANELVAKLSKPRHAAQVRGLCQELTALTARIPERAASVKAAEAVRLVAAELAGARGPQFADADLAVALANLAPRLEPADAEAVTAQLAAEIARTTSARTAQPLATALAATAARLPAARAQERAAASATVLLGRMKQAGPPADLHALAAGVIALAPRLEPGAAARTAAEAAPLLIAALGKPEALDWAEALAADLSRLAAYLSAADADTRAGEAVAVLARRMDAPVSGPREARRLVAALARAFEKRDPKKAGPELLAALRRTGDDAVAQQLGVIAAAVAKRAAPKDAQALAGEVSTALAARMAAAGDTADFPLLAVGLAAALERAGPEAAAVCSTLVGRMGRTAALYPRLALARGVAAAAARAESAAGARYAKEAAGLLIDVIQNSPGATPSALPTMVTDLNALLDRVPAATAAQLADVLAGWVQEKLDRADDLVVLRPLADALAAIAPRLERDRAADRLGRAARGLLARMDSPDSSQVSLPLAEGVRALAERIEPRAAAELLLGWLASSVRSDETPFLAIGLEHALARLPEGEARPHADRAGQLAFARVARQFAEDFSGRLSALLKVVAARGSRDALVEMLKHPYCLGAARETLLAELGRRCGRPFGSVWDFVAWADHEAPELDLRSPLRPPE